MWKSFVLELRGEWSEFADECIGLLLVIDAGHLSETHGISVHVDRSRRHLRVQGRYTG